MPSVTINLKEVFSNDSQLDLSSKINFNFNQLIALGVGQPGQIGPTGLQGAAGPIGPAGPAGETGSLIYSSSTTVASSPGVTIPSGIRVNDVLITGDSIWQKNLTNWTKATDFNQLVITALGVNVSPYSLLKSGSRIITPRITIGTDLTNSIEPTDPTYSTPGTGNNYQTVLHNFNLTNTYSVRINGSGSIVMSTNGVTPISFDANLSVNTGSDSINVNTHGLSNGEYVIYSNNGGTNIGGLTNSTSYYALVVDVNNFKLCASPADVVSTTPVNLTSLGSGVQNLLRVSADSETIFPNTANLTLYSYFDGIATEAREFASTAKGYRHQLELGSIDNISTTYPNSGGGGGTVTQSQYLISPSFENLKIRKYRIENLGWSNPYPGSYFLRAEYDISSVGSESATSFSPRRNSEHLWKINKSENSKNDSRVIEMRLTNSNIIGATDSSAGFSIDGIFIKKGVSSNDANNYYFGIGFSTDVSRIKIAGSSTNTGTPLTAVQFDGLGIELKNGSGLGNLSIDGSGNLTISTASADSSGNLTMTAHGQANITSTTDNVTISATDATKLIKIGNSSEDVPNAPIVIKNDRLAQGLPFATSRVSSSDPNTLDDYVEGTLGTNSTGAGRFFINMGYTYVDGFGIPNAVNGSIDCSTFLGFINYSSYRYTKIGRLVNFTARMQVNLNYWPDNYTPSGGTSHQYTGLGIYLPYAVSGDFHSSVSVLDLTTLPDPYISVASIPYGETCYTNFVGMTKAVQGDTTSIIYLYSPTVLPTDTTTAPTTRLNQYILFDRNARKPYDSGASKYSESVEIWVSGSYTAAT